MSDVPDRRLVLAALFAVALCVWCGWASGFHHSSTPALATWSASVAGVVVVDLLFWRGRLGGRLGLHLPPADTVWPRPGQEGSGPVIVGLSPWLALILVVLVWELLGIDTGPHQAHLTISALAQAFRPLDAALLLVWILVGVGYGAARARAPVGRLSGGTAHGASPGASASAAVSARHAATVPALLLPSSRAVGVAFWIGLIVACVLVEIAARQSRGRLADAEEFVRQISGPTAANALLVVIWMYAGWHLFAH
jgi:hypothetical protein